MCIVILQCMYLLKITSHKLRFEQKELLFKVKKCVS